MQLQGGSVYIAKMGPFLIGDGKLNKFKRTFIEKYLSNNGNGALAVKEAGWKGKAIYEKAYDLLHEPEVQKEIERRTEIELKAVGVETKQVLTELARIGFSDPRRLFREDGSLKPPSEWDDETAAAVASIESFEEFEGKGEEKKQIGFTKKIRLWDKTEALKHLGKHVKAFNVDSEKESGPLIVFQTININKPDNTGLSEE